MDIITNTLNILNNKVFKVLSIIFICVLCLVATEVAQAKTISDNFTLIDTSRLTYFENIYLRENYKHYLLASETVDTSTYNSYTNYYLCLSNTSIDATSGLNASATCDKMYRYYRDTTTNDYLVEQVEDNTLSVSNSIYYTNNIKDKEYIIIKLLILINIGVMVFYLSYVLLKLFWR